MESESKVHQLLDTQEFSFYFKCDGSVFGCPEEGRIVYASLKMGNKDKDHTKSWKEDANFLAVNLDDILEGKGSQRVFSVKDLKKIKVIDREEAVKDLVKKEKDI